MYLKADCAVRELVTKQSLEAKDRIHTCEPLGGFDVCPQTVQATSHSTFAAEEYASMMELQT
jgi:hypothetical protein